MSQYVQLGEEPRPGLVPHYPTTFDPLHSPTFAGNQSNLNDIRHDICHVSACASNTCSIDSVAHPEGYRFMLEMYSLSTTNNSIASCSFQPFHADSGWIPVNNQSYSPYRYIRAWFQWSYHHSVQRRRLTDTPIHIPEYSEYLYKIPLT